MLDTVVQTYESQHSGAGSMRTRSTGYPVINYMRSSVWVWSVLHEALDQKNKISKNNEGRKDRQKEGSKE